MRQVGSTTTNGHSIPTNVGRRLSSFKRQRPQQGKSIDHRTPRAAYCVCIRHWVDALVLWHYLLSVCDWESYAQSWLRFTPSTRIVSAFADKIIQRQRRLRIQLLPNSTGAFMIMHGWATDHGSVATVKRSAKHPKRTAASAIRSTGSHGLPQKSCTAGCMRLRMLCHMHAKAACCSQEHDEQLGKVL